MARRARKTVDQDFDNAESGGANSGAGAKRGNGYDKEQVESFVERILNVHGEIAAETSAMMLACKNMRKDITEILNEAKAAGIPKKALRKVVSKRILESKIEGLRDDLEGDDQDAYDNLLHALGDLGGTPLGAAALAGAANGSAAHA